MGMVRDGGMAVGEKNEDIEQEKRKGNGKRKRKEEKREGGRKNGRSWNPV